MHMDMEYRLAGSFIDVDSDIISVGVITLVHLLLHVLEHHIHCFTLMIGQIEIGGDMTLGNYQSMAGLNWVTVIESHARSRLANHLHPTRQTTEGTLFSFLPWKFIEMIVLVKLITRIAIQTQKR